jgi:hypothetical protein
MTPHKLSSFAAVLCFTFVSSMNAQQSSAERVAEIQAALRAAKLDDWLNSILLLSTPRAMSRWRWL